MFDTALLAPQTLGVLSFGLALLAFAPYIRDTFAGRTKPQRSSWVIWATVASIALASQIAAGAHQSLWFAVGNWLVTLIILSVSIKHGTGGFFALRDRASLAASACILVLWYLTDAAELALASAIAVNCLGAWLTILKAYRAPQTETLCTWGIAAAASALGLVAVGELDPVLMAYPLFLVGLRLGVATAILLGRRRLAASDKTRAGEISVV